MNKATSDDSEMLQLALSALSQLSAQKQINASSIQDSDVEEFCTAILNKADDHQIEIIESLISKKRSLDLVYQEFIPKVAARLGHLWNENAVSFVEVSIGVQRLQRLAHIYEQRYLGPLYLYANGPEILLVLPANETHTLGLITAAAIFRKNGTDPHLAIGFSDEELFKAIENHDFKMIGISASCSNTFEEILRLENIIRSKTNGKTPIILGTNTDNLTEEQRDLDVFDLVTSDPFEAIMLISKSEQNTKVSTKKSRH